MSPNATTPARLDAVDDEFGTPHRTAPPFGPQRQRFGSSGVLLHDDAHGAVPASAEVPIGVMVMAGPRKFDYSDGLSQEF